MLTPNDYLQTPEWVYDPLGPFDLDPCAGKDTNIGITNWCDQLGQDGLEKDWFGFVFCNPPFSQKTPWIEKMKKHGNGLLLLPERGSAPWFGPTALAAGSYFVMGKKINFNGGSSSNNVGSVLFCFGEEAARRINRLALPGHLVHVQYFIERN
jgi:hypothetical protein